MNPLALHTRCLIGRPYVRFANCRYISSRPSQALLQESLSNPADFWGNASNEISWFQKPTSILDSANAPFYRWFAGGQLNTCYNCVDRHVESGFGSQAAIIYDSPVTDVIRTITYNELLKAVKQFAGVLRNLGVSKGDTVIVYMPNIPESAIAMLSCARLGAVHCVVFGGFASAELAVRIRDCKPKVVISASCGIEGQKVVAYKPLLDRAIDLASDVHKVEKCIVLQRPQCKADMVSARDHDWDKDIRNLANPVTTCTAVDSCDPLYIIYTSGTTGSPKGILRDNGGHAVALHWTMQNIYGCNPGEVFWAASDVGWVVGHSYSVYGPLLHRNTTLIYEGKPVGTPDAGNFWRTSERHGVSILFTAPTAIRAIKRIDVNGAITKQFNHKLRALFLAGEHADPETVHWAERALKIPVLDHWWQTETGWPICANLLGIDGVVPIKYGSTFHPCPGFDVHILDDDGNHVPPGTLGNIAVKLPLPPGCLSTLYNNNERFISSYLESIPGYYDTSDAGMIDDEGYVYVMSRKDDVINVAGHRLSTGAMEEVMYEHPDISEAAVVGIKDSMKGQVPLGLFVLNSNSTKSESQIQGELVQLMRQEIGAVACFKLAVQVNALPKTRSGKVVRNILRAMASGDAYEVPPTIESLDVVKEAEEVIRRHGKLFE